MTAVKKNTAWKLSRDTDTRPLTRRRFASMLPAIASTMAWPLVLDYFQGERRFFAQAAELSGDRDGKLESRNCATAESAWLTSSVGRSAVEKRASGASASTCPRRVPKKTS